ALPPHLSALLPGAPPSANGPVRAGVRRPGDGRAGPDRPVRPRGARAGSRGDRRQGLPPRDTGRGRRPDPKGPQGVAGREALRQSGLRLRLEPAVHVQREDPGARRRRAPRPEGSRHRLRPALAQNRPRRGADDDAVATSKPQRAAAAERRPGGLMAPTGTMRAVFYQGARTFTPGKATIQAAGLGEALLRVLRVGICGTDLHIFQGHLDNRVPRGGIIGHETFAEVVEAPADSGIRAGDRVAVEPIRFCGTCRACRIGASYICYNLKVLGVDLPGGMQEDWPVPLDRLIKV